MSWMSPARCKAILLVIWMAVAVVSALVLLAGQREGEREVRTRFGDRTELAARFTATYTQDVLAQERRLASRELTGKRVSADRFGRVVDLLGNEAAVLLDDRGRALHVAPFKASVIGTNLAEKYEHLHSAAEGRPTVSKVVASAATGVPVVAFATPYGSGPTRRVFSGAFDVEKSPIGAYLRNTTSLAGARVYLLDVEGVIVASNHPVARRGHINRADPDLWRALSTRSTRTANDYEVAGRPVIGTNWRLVISVPRAQLLEPVQGAGRYVPWLLWAGLVLAGLGCALLVGNLISSRARLRQANSALEQLARVDALTGLDNRRHIEEAVHGEIANADRYGRPFSILLIDIDHFKAVNDTHGHEIGDDVLRFVAHRLGETLRTGDRVGRWGGEEFLVVLPSTGLNGAERVAQRLRAHVASQPVALDDQPLAVTVSVGAATRLDDETGESLVARADQAMYAAKAAGRDWVATASGTAQLDHGTLVSP